MTKIPDTHHRSSYAAVELDGTWQSLVDADTELVTLLLAAPDYRKFIRSLEAGEGIALSYPSISQDPAPTKMGIVTKENIQPRHLEVVETPEGHVYKLSIQVTKF